MYISDLILDNYRSYAQLQVKLEPGVVLLLGANGQGKTNFVEAIGYLSNLHSHRANQDAALVRYAPQNQILASAGVQSVKNESGAPNGQGLPQAAVIRSRVYRGERSFTVDLEIIAGRANRARLNKNVVPPKEIRGLLKTVIFAPEDLQIIKGDPSARRRFIDDFVVLLEPFRAGVIAAHQKVLKQRGALLKEISKKRRRREDINLELTTLAVWNEQLIELASEIIVARNQWLNRLANPLAQAYLNLLEESVRKHCAQRLCIGYQLGFTAAQINCTDVEAVRGALRAATEELRDDEFARGVNLVGAHRDELIFSLDELPVKGYASHGETWSTALALRLAQFDLLCDQVEVPILILDDVFAELDSARREALVEVIKRAEQVFITAAVAEDVPSELTPQIFRVRRHPEGSEVVPDAATLPLPEGEPRNE